VGDGHVDQAVFRRLYDKATDVKKLINGFLRYLRSAAPRDSALAEAPESDYLTGMDPTGECPAQDEAA